MNCWSKMIINHNSLTKNSYFMGSHMKNKELERKQRRKGRKVCFKSLNICENEEITCWLETRMIWTWAKSQYMWKLVGCLNNGFPHHTKRRLLAGLRWDTRTLGCSTQEWRLGCVSFMGFDRLRISSPLNDKVRATKYTAFCIPQ